MQELLLWLYSPSENGGPDGLRQARALTALIRWINMLLHDMSHKDIWSLPMTEPVLLILLSLADRPRHGYAILQDTGKMSDGRARLSTGTLYGALRRLLEDGWIERFQSEDNSRGKQAYRLTRLGQRNLQREVHRLKYLTRVAGLRVLAKER
jgi:DNA-binding PadR family transcriptional regulator